MGASTSIVWFRQDLRVLDNPALAAAAERGGPILPVFIWSPEEEGRWCPGAASRWWLHVSLQRLDEELRRLGLRLVLRRGPALGALRDLMSESGARAVTWNRRYEPLASNLEQEIQRRLREEGAEPESFNGALLFEPWEICTRTGNPFRVFAPFWKCCLSRGVSASGELAPSALRAPEKWPLSLPLQELALHPRQAWTSGWEAIWKPGEAGAGAALERFLEEQFLGYPVKRDRPAENGSSRLSPHLHFGEISPRRIWHAVQEHAGRLLAGGSMRASEEFLREIGWREFAHHVLHHFPHTAEKPLRADYASFRWSRRSQDLEAWKRGMTGYPLVDAGMRELWATGWMHNRARMLVASFLVKDLMIHWLEGARWFWDTLVDADLANNTMGWQWSAGCGADAVPYFRIFNPVLQGTKVDPDGAYVRRWVPELARLPKAWIHRPFEAPVEVLAAARVELGKTYPRALVDHVQARASALAAFSDLSPEDEGE